MTDAAELIARIRANVDELQAGMAKADDIVRQGSSTLNETAKNAGRGMGDALGGGFDAGTQRTLGQAISAISPALGSVVTAAGPAGMALAVVTADIKAFSEAWQLAEKGAAASELHDNYVRITGSIQASEEMTQKLRRATQGTVEDTNLWIIANRAVNMGVTKNVDEMARLATIFKNLGEASGMGAEQSISAGMQALGALQTRGLKTLGLSLDDTKIWDEYAQKLGTTAAKLDDVQKRAALVQAVLATAPGGLAESAASAADKAEAMHVSIKNLNTEIGRSIEGLLSMGGIVTDIAGGAAKRLAEIRGAQEVSAPYRAKMQELISEGDIKRAIEYKIQLDLLDKAILTGQLTTSDYELIMESFDKTVLSVSQGIAYFAQKSYDGALATAQMNVQLGNEAAAAKIVADQLWIAGDATAYYNRMSASWSAPGGYSDKAGLMAHVPENIQMSMGGMPSGMTSSWGMPTRAISAVSGGGGGGASSWEADMRQQASEMRSLVESILQPTSVTQADFIGPYIDKWDEYARKMRAIAADQGSVWRQMVPKDVLAQGEEAIKSWAATQEKAFYSGQKPEEINWDDFVNRAKDMVASQQAREAMIKMGAERLAQAGIGTIQAADLLGLNSPGAQIGADAAKSFAQGAAGADVGLSVTKAFGDSITASAKTWESYGAVAISYFITGSQSKITPALGASFAEQIWPFFKGFMERDSQREGALP